MRERLTQTPVTRSSRVTAVVDACQIRYRCWNASIEATAERASAVAPKRMPCWGGTPMPKPAAAIAGPIAVTHTTANSSAPIRVPSLETYLKLARSVGRHDQPRDLAFARQLEDPDVHLHLQFERVEWRGPLRDEVEGEQMRIGQ